MNAWDEVLAENASDAQSQLDEECPDCGARYADHAIAGDRTMQCKRAAAPVDEDHERLLAFVAKADHFAGLKRHDLRVPGRVCDVLKTLLPRGGAYLGLSEDDTVLAAHEEDPDTDAFQAVVSDYDYCVEQGISWWLVPLAFGPVMENVEVGRGR